VPHDPSRGALFPPGDRTHADPDRFSSDCTTSRTTPLDSPFANCHKWRLRTLHQLTLNIHGGESKSSTSKTFTDK
jgi:hypothetical protein